MSDKELLELAAKAAGYMEFDSAEPFEVYRFGDWHEWNPLTDDGDALRLAVKLNLRINIDFDTDRNEVRCYQEDVECAETGDPYAATRRAVVRAAASIGKAMP